jgi:hypothetical protein
VIAIYEELKKQVKQQASRQAAKGVFESDPCLSFFFLFLFFGGIRPGLERRSTIYEISTPLQTANEPADVYPS